jgi:hypothetical protein
MSRIEASERGRLPQRGALAPGEPVGLAFTGTVCAFLDHMSSFPLGLAVASVAISVAVACRSPQDPSRFDGPLARDGGTAPENPEVQPNTGPAIGPIASDSTGGSAPQQMPGLGGLGGIGGGGVGGVAGASRVVLR